jgi:hypothetical protein
MGHVAIIQLAGQSSEEGTQRIGEALDVGNLNWPAGTPHLQVANSLSQLKSMLTQEFQRNQSTVLVLINTHSVSGRGAFHDLHSFPGAPPVSARECMMHASVGF